MLITAPIALHFYLYNKHKQGWEEKMMCWILTVKEIKNVQISVLIFFFLGTFNDKEIL